MEKSLVLASNNKGKLREFQAIFAELGVDVINQGALGVEACPEPFGTFIENCLAKARHASKMTGRPAMADDSGVCVNALNGMPGVLSARFAGEPSNDEANNRLLVERLQGKDDRRAHYTCVLTAVRTPDDPEPLVFVEHPAAQSCLCPYRTAPQGRSWPSAAGTAKSVTSLRVRAASATIHTFLFQSTVERPQS